MADVFFHLRRRVSPEISKVEIENSTGGIENSKVEIEKWKDFSLEYYFDADSNTDALSNLLMKQYSKTQLITQVLNDLKQCDTSIDKKDRITLMRAILTDQGLLTAQTRERTYLEPQQSRKELGQNGDWYIMHHARVRRFRRQPFPEEPRKTRNVTKTQIIEQYFKQRDSFLKEQAYPPVNWDVVKQALILILNACGEKKKHLKDVYHYEDPGSVEGDIRDHPEKLKQYITKWMCTAYFEFEKGKKHIPADTYLSNLDIYTEDFTYLEEYQLLAHVLPFYINLEDHWFNPLVPLPGKGSCSCMDSYHPILLNSQSSLYRDQREAFYNEDLSAWKDALPAIEKCLAVTEDDFSVSCYGKAHRPNSLCYDLARCRDILSSAIQQYVGYGEKCDYSELAINIINSVQRGNNQCFFADKPLLLFRIIRSPSHRKWFTDDTRCVLRRVLKEAWIDQVIPITHSSLEADGKLYQDIVECCDIMCRHAKISFDKYAWQRLWDCIRQAVMCLDYELEDLISYRDLFPTIWKDERVILDHWVRKMLRNIDQTRTAQIVSSIATKAGGDGIWSFVREYRCLFEQPTTTFSDIVPLLRKASSFGWTRIASFMPKQNRELEQIANELNLSTASAYDLYQELRYQYVRKKQQKLYREYQEKKEREQKKNLDNVKKISGSDPEPVPNPDYDSNYNPYADFDSGASAIHLVLTEWMLLQLLCEWTRYEIFEIMVVLLKEDHKDEIG